MSSASNMRTANQRTGGQILVDQLKIHGVDLAFCVPGESYLAALDALWESSDALRLITTRIEIGAATMAGPMARSPAGRASAS
jgi:acetolactate synthase-1/2/3 large subunit